MSKISKYLVSSLLLICGTFIISQDPGYAKGDLTAAQASSLESSITSDVNAYTNLQGSIPYLNKAESDLASLAQLYPNNSTLMAFYTQEQGTIGLDVAEQVEVAISTWKVTPNNTNYIQVGYWLSRFNPYINVYTLGQTYTGERAEFAQDLSGAVDNAISNFASGSGTSTAVTSAISNLAPYDDAKTLIPQEVLKIAAQADTAIMAYVNAINSQVGTTTSVILTVINVPASVILKASAQAWVNLLASYNSVQSTLGTGGVYTYENHKLTAYILKFTADAAIAAYTQLPNAASLSAAQGAVNALQPYNDITINGVGVYTIDLNNLLLIKEADSPRVPLSAPTPSVGPVLVNYGVYVPQINNNRVVYLRYSAKNQNFRAHELNLRTGQKSLLASIPALQLPAPYTEQIVSVYGDNVAYFDTNTGKVWILNTAVNNLQEVGTKVYPTNAPIQLKLYANFLLVISGSNLDVWNLNSNQAMTLSSHCVSADIAESWLQMAYVENINGTYSVKKVWLYGSGNNNIDIGLNLEVVYTSSKAISQVSFSQAGNLNLAWVGLDNNNVAQIYFWNQGWATPRQLTSSTVVSNVSSLTKTASFFVWRNGTNIQAIKVSDSPLPSSVVNEVKSTSSVTDSLSGFYDQDRIIYTVNNVSTSYAATHPNSMPMEQLTMLDLAPTSLTIPLAVTISGTGMGTVSAYPTSIQCSNDPSQLAIFCTGMFTKGESVTLKIIPSTGMILKAPVTGIGSTPIVLSNLSDNISLTMNSSMNVGITFAGSNPDMAVTTANWVNYLGTLAPHYAISSPVIQSVITQMKSSVGLLSPTQLIQTIPNSSLNNINLTNLLTPVELASLPGLSGTNWPDPSMLAPSFLTVTNLLNYTEYGVAQSKVTAFNDLVNFGIAPTSSQMTTMFNDMNSAVSFAASASKTILGVASMAFNDITSVMTSALKQAIAFQGQIYNLLKNPPSYLAPILAPLDPSAMTSLVNDAVSQITQLVKNYPNPSSLSSLVADPILGPIIAIPGVGSAIQSAINSAISTTESILNDVFCFGFC